MVEEEQDSRMVAARKKELIGEKKVLEALTATGGQSCTCGGLAVQDRRV